MQLRRSAQLQQHSNSKLTPLYTKKLADLFVSLSISSNFTIKRRHFYFISHVNWILFVEFTPSNSCHGFFQKKLCFPPIKFENSSNRHLQDYGLLPNKTKSEDQVQEICFSTFIISSSIYRRTSDKDSPCEDFQKSYGRSGHNHYVICVSRDFCSNLHPGSLAKFFLNFGRSGTTSYVIYSESEKLKYPSKFIEKSE